MKLIYGNKTREKCFDMLYGESIENVGNRNTRPVVAKGSDDSVFTNYVVSAITNFEFKLPIFFLDIVKK